MSASDVVILSRVVSGWTGTITLTNAATSATYVLTPPGRTSGASIWEDAAYRLQVLMGATAYGWADSSLQLHLASATFTLVATGTTQSRLKLTGTYSGVTSLTTAAAPDDVLQGNALDHAMPAGSYQGQAAAGDGVLGSRPRVRSPTGQIRLYNTTSLAAVVTLEEALDDGETYDAFLNGRVLSRFRAGAVTRARWGRKATQARLDVDGSAVAL